MSWANTRGNVKVAGISAWKVRDTGKTEDFSLPFLRDGKITETTLFSKNTRGQELPYAIKIEASAKMMATGSLTNIIELLDTLASTDLHQQIVAINGLTWDTSLLSSQFFGFRWKFVSDKDRDSDRYIEIMMDGIIKISELPTIHGTPHTSVTDATSAIKNLLNLGRSDIVPAGIDKIEYRVADAVSFSDEFGKIRKSTFTAETLASVDGKGSSIPYAISINFSAECMQASSTEVGLLDDLAGAENDFQITFADGRVALLNNQSGITFTHSIESDSNDISFIKVSGSGVVQFSEWDGIWT